MAIKPAAAGVSWRAFRECRSVVFGSRPGHQCKLIVGINALAHASCRRAGLRISMGLKKRPRHTNFKARRALFKASSASHVVAQNGMARRGSFARADFLARHGISAWQDCHRVYLLLAGQWAGAARCVAAAVRFHLKSTSSKQVAE